MPYKKWDDLENAIKREIGFAIRDTTYNAQIELINNLERFYDTPDPKRYRRTDHLGRSSQSEYTDTAFGGFGKVYLDESVPYTTGTYDTHKVYEEAEDHGSGIIGKPHFWIDTLDKLENDILPTAFKNHGFRIK